MSNKIISSINAIIDNQTLPNNPNNVVAIDTQNSCIGVKTATPMHEIDVSGTIRTNDLIIKNNGKIKNGNMELLFNSNTNRIITNNTNRIITNTIDLSNIYINNIYNSNSSYININSDVSINGILETNDLSVNANIFVDNDVSINRNLFVNTDISNNRNINSRRLIVNDICVNNIYSKNLNNKIDICANLDLSGDLVIDGSARILGQVGGEYFVLTSDDRLKHNELVINNALNVINKLNPQLYQKTKNFKAHDFSGIVNESYIIEAGLIAQELELLDDISFCVNSGNNVTPYSVNYNNIFVYGLAAIKELDNKINYMIDNSINSINNIIIQLQKIVSNQHLEINILKKKINDLEK